MTNLRCLRLAVALCATLIAAACSSPDPMLYTIAPVPGAVVSGAPKVIALHGVGVAQYLVRSPIVQTSGDYRIMLRPGSWWGEPIDAMLGRVLVQDLSQRLPQSTVYSSSGAVSGSSPDATIELEVQRLDLDRDGQLLLIAQASVSFNKREIEDIRSFHLSQSLPSPSVEGQIAATSAALGQVADRLAGMLAAKSTPAAKPAPAARSHHK
jgi:uncharacterized lipoprotein YmbA